jgi:hypothetical protein
MLVSTVSRVRDSDAPHFWRGVTLRRNSVRERTDPESIRREQIRTGRNGVVHTTVVASEVRWLTAVLGVFQFAHVA